MKTAFAWRQRRNHARPVTRLLLTLASVLTVGAAACSATSPDQPAVWGSDQANLTFADSSATLVILASGGCFGSFGNFDRPLPAGPFSIPGTYTQLTGAFPGKIQYAALFSGTVTREQIAMTITVPALQGAIGPFALVQGVTAAWPACMYP